MSSAKTGPAQAPTRIQIAAPENHVTSARATPKKPNCASFLATTSGIQTEADSAYPAIAIPVITPVGTNTRTRTLPSRSNHAVNHQSPALTARATIAHTMMPAPSPAASRKAPSSAEDASTTTSQVAPRQ